MSEAEGTRSRSSSTRSGPSSTGSVITFDPAALERRVDELEQELSEPGFWDDQERAQQISTEHARVPSGSACTSGCRPSYDDAVELLELEPGMAGRDRDVDHPAAA